LDMHFHVIFSQRPLRPPLAIPASFKMLLTLVQDRPNRSPSSFKVSSGLSSAHLATRASRSVNFAFMVLASFSNISASLIFAAHSTSEQPTALEIECSIRSSLALLSILSNVRPLGGLPIPARLLE